MATKKKQRKIDEELLSRFEGGLIFSPEDKRDYTLEDAEVPMCAAVLPDSYRTEGKMPVLNQLTSSMCVGHAIATAMGYGEYKVGFKNAHNFSRAMIYANRRPTDYQGEGMMTREALRQTNHHGDCLYDSFPMLGSYPDLKKEFEKNQEKFLTEAESFKLVNYFRCYSKEDVKRALMNQGAVVIAIDIYDGFGAEVKLPEPGTKSKGGHAMCCVGWDKTGWILQNSWGTLSGKKGFVHLPYEYPVREWWGLTVNKDVPFPPKRSFWQSLKNFFSKVGFWIKIFLGRKNK